MDTLIHIIELYIEVGNPVGLLPLKLTRISVDKHRTEKKLMVLSSQESTSGGGVQFFMLKLALALCSISILISFLEIFTNESNKNNKSALLTYLARQAFHGTHVMISFGNIVTLLTFLQFPSEFSQTFQNVQREIGTLLKYQRRERRRYENNRNKKTAEDLKFSDREISDCVLVSFMISLLVSITIFPIVGMPLISFRFHQIIYSWACAHGHFSLSNGVLHFLLDFVRLLPLPFTWPPFIVLGILTIRVIKLKTNLLRKTVIATTGNNILAQTIRREVATEYRKMELITIFSNGHLQRYCWPAMQFNGSAIIILLLYFLIKFWEILDGRFLTVIFVFLISYILFIGFFFEYASKPYILSKSLLSVCNGHWRKYPWSKRFFKSCQKIALRVDSFHMIDRERAPLIMRYCIQRTFALLKTTSEWKYAGNE